MMEFYPAEFAKDPREVIRIRAFYSEILKTLSSRITVHSTLVALLYCQRLVTKLNCRIHPDFGLSVLSACFLLADHCVNDEAISLGLWAQVTRTRRVDLARLKQKVLLGLDFQLVVTEEQYAVWIAWVGTSLNSMPRSPASPTVSRPEKIIPLDNGKIMSLV